MGNGILNTYINIIDNFQRYFEQEFFDRDEHEVYNEIDSYGYVPSTMIEVHEDIQCVMGYVKRNEKEIKNILEVGCGIGTVIFLLKNVFNPLKATGMDIDDNLLYKGAEIFGNEIEFSYANALEYKMYNNYDLIYFYRPFKSDETQQKFENKLFNDILKGTLVMMRSNFLTRKRKDLFYIRENICLKV